MAYDHVEQNGNALTYTIVGDTIIFDAVPDAGNITLTVANQAPTLNVIANSSIDQADGTQTVNLAGITAGTSESQVLTVSATTANTSLIKNLIVTYNSPDATGSISFNPDPAATGTTTITVRVTDDGTPVKYTERTFTVAVTSTATGTKETMLSEKDLTIAPNPASDLLTISSEKQLSSSTVSLEEASGVIVYEKFFSSFNKLQLDLSGKKAGVYLLRIRSDQGTIVKKVVVL